MARIVLLLSSLLLSTSILPVAAGQSASSSARANGDPARVHFDRGVELYREGSYDGALVEFERYHQLSHNYKILFNIAQVQVERHEYVSAIEHFKRYLNEGEDEIPEDRRNSVLLDIKKLRQRVATLTIDVNTSGAKVFVNGALQGTSPLAAPVSVNVGPCYLRVEKAGFATLERTITVAGADRPRVFLSLIAEPDATPRPLSHSPKVTPERNLTPFWVSMGAMVALGGAAATFGVLTGNARDLLDDALLDIPGNADQIDSARSKLRTRAALTDGFGLATLIAGGAAIYFILNPPEEGADHPAQGQTQLSFGPGRVRLDGTF